MLSVSCSAKKAPPLDSYTQANAARVAGLEVKSPLPSPFSSWWQLLVAFPTSGPQVGPCQLIREVLTILSLKRGGTGVLILSLLVGTQYIFIKLNFIESVSKAKNVS